MVFQETGLGFLINIEAILFGVLGFLYTVYAQYSGSVTSEAPIRARIAGRLRNVCRFIAVLIIVDTLLLSYGLIKLWPCDGTAQIIAVGIAMSISSIAGISVVIAKGME